MLKKKVSKNFMSEYQDVILNLVLDYKTEKLNVNLCINAWYSKYLLNDMSLDLFTF